MKLFKRNLDYNMKIVTFLEESDLLMKGVNEKTKNGTKRQKVEFLGIL